MMEELAVQFGFAVFLAAYCGIELGLGFVWH